jgi:hypothetical protein
MTLRLRYLTWKLRALMWLLRRLRAGRGRSERDADSVAPDVAPAKSGLDCDGKKI